MYSIIELMHSSQSLLHDDSVTLVLVLLLGDPHALEVAQLGQDAASAPAHNVALGGGERPNLDLLADKFFHLVHESVWEALEHRVPSRQNDVVVQGFPQVDVHLRQAIQHQLGESWVS